MGEAKRRKEKGLPPKKKKTEKKSSSRNKFLEFRRNQTFPLIAVAAFVIYLIYDLFRYYTQ